MKKENGFLVAIVTGSLVGAAFIALAEGTIHIVRKDVSGTPAAVVATTDFDR